MSKKLLYRIVHCSDTRSTQQFTAKDIVKWHTDKPPLGNGWIKPGYNDVIERDGSLVTLIPYNDDDIVDIWEIANGASGYNGVARHVCLMGGRDAIGKLAGDFTPEQWATLRNLLIMDVAKHENIQIGGHGQFDQKKLFCPGFDVKIKLREWGFSEKNIYQR